MLSGETQRPEQFAEEHVRGGSFYLDKYRILPIGIFRRANARARKYHFVDIREKGGLSLDEISFVVDPGLRAQPTRQLPSKKRMSVSPWREPRKLYLASPHHLAEISGIIHPDQDMVGAIMKEIA